MAWHQACLGFPKPAVRTQVGERQPNGEDQYITFVAI
jgi:hypothetical protein